MSELGKYHRTGEGANGRMGEEYQSPARPLAHPPVRRAFTLLEIMVAMTIIAILATIAAVAYHGVIGGNKTAQTRATLGTLRGMLSEYENATHFQTGPAEWEWAPSNAAAPTVGANGVVSIGTKIAEMQSQAAGAPDFWHIPFINTSIVPNFPDPLVAPPSVVFKVQVMSPYGLTNVLDRDNSVAVVNTQIVMNLLASLPVNQAVLKKMGTGSTEFLAQNYSVGSTPYQTSNLTLTAGGVTNSGSRTAVPSTILFQNLPDGAVVGVMGTKNDAKQGQEYVSGIQVADSMDTSNRPIGPFTYQWTGAMGSADAPAISTGTSPPATDGQWTLITGAGTPIFLDGWGNPIIFVPGSGLMVRMSGNVTSTNPLGATLIQSPDHKPFWASAGPDGDFSNGDDNIYSFEQ